MKPLKSILLLSLCLVDTAFAVQKPIAYPTDSRIKMVAFQENNVIEVQGRTLTSTQLIFARGEYVVNIDGGDSAVWSVTNKKVTPNVISIKPNHLGLDSNLTVFTNKHIYFFHITSNKALKKEGSQPTYAIKFSYPEDDRAKARAVMTQKQKTKQKIPIKTAMHYVDYTFSGNNQLKPLHVFDDGTFTYFEFSRQTPVPAIFAVDGTSGKESLVNDYRQGKYMVVKRIAPQFTLREGSEFVASVFNTREINRIKKGA